MLSGRDDKRAELVLDNVLIRRTGTHSSPAQVAKTAKLTATRLTIEHLPFDRRGEVKLENCIINGKPMPEGTPATGADREKLMRDLMPVEYRERFSHPKNHSFPP